MKKTTLFIGHSNNDVDHYIPVMVQLQKENKINSLLVCLPSETILLKNDIHRYWVNACSFNVISASKLLFRSFLQQMLYAVFSRLETTYHGIAEISLRVKFDFPCRCLVFIRKVLGFLKQPLENLITSLLRDEDCERILETFFAEHAVACLVADTSTVANVGNERELVLKMRGVLVRFAHKKGIPIFMFTHGVWIRYYPGFARHSMLPTHLKVQPDSVSAANAKELDKCRYAFENAKNFMVGGDVRLDIGWMRNLEETAKKLPDYRPLAETPGKVVLYLAGSFSWLNNDALLDSLHADICGLADKFPDLTVWVKMHPRYPLQFPFLKYRGRRVRVFGNKTDSNLLVARADVVISPFSGILLQPMLLKRGAIFYDKIREVTGAPWDYIFDYTDCIEKARNPLELELACKKILEGHVGNFEKLEEYYAKYISGGATLEQSMMGKYVDEILRLCGESGRL